MAYAFEGSNPSAPNDLEGDLASDLRADRTDWLILLGLIALTLFTFLPAIRCGFIDLDDPGTISLHPLVAGGLTLASIRGAFTSVEAFYYPLTLISLEIDASLYGLNPWGFHLTNVLLHTGSAAMLWWFLRLSTGARWRSAGVAAIFAIHPLRVESVVWAAERKDVLCVFFGMLTLVAYGHYATRPSPWRLASVVACYGMSLLSKATLVTLPCLLLVLDYWPLGRLNFSVFRRSGVHWISSAAGVAYGRLALEKLPLALPAIAITVVTLFGQSRMGTVQTMEEVGVGGRLANVALSYVRYIERMVHFNDLALFYPFEPVPALVAIPAAAVILLATALVFYFGLSRRPWLVTGWLWYLGTFIPMIGLVAIGGIAMADRYSYFPCIGLLIMALWSLPCPSSASHRFGYGAAAVAALFVILVSTRVQIGYWKNSSILWEHDLQIAPNAGMPQAAYADVLLHEGRPDEAIPHLRAALQLEKIAYRAPPLHARLAIALQQTGDTSGAIQEYATAIKLNPQRKEFYTDLAALLAAHGQRATAARCYAQALRLDPGDVVAHLGLATLEEQSGALAQSIADYRQALAVEPGRVDARIALAAVLQRGGALDEAAAQYAQAVRMEPRSGDAQDGWGKVLLLQHKAGEAARHFAQAVRLNPDSAPMHNHLGAALVQSGDLDRAISEIEVALRLDPNYAAARDNLARAREVAGLAKPPATAASEPASAE